MSSNTSFLSKYTENLYKKIYDNFKTLVLVGCGSVVLIYGGYHAYHQLVTLRNKTSYELYLLKKKILSLYPKYKNKVFLKIDKRQQIEDPSGLIFEIILIENLQKKPDLNSNINKSDPFLPPFEEGQFISEISSTHNLLFNKFLMVKYHVLITTKFFELQTSPLNHQDFYAWLKVMKAIEGFGFYNGGEGSGMSVPHKHMQVIPSRNSNYSIFELINERVKEKTLIGSSDDGAFLLKEFKFRHVIRLIDIPNEESIEKGAEILLNAYEKALNDLENSNLKIPYNLVVTEDWILVVLRSKEKALDVSFNSMAFSGSFLVKDEKNFQDIINLKNPSKILEEISIK